MAAMLNKGILGTKVGMTRIFQEDGTAVATTVVEAGPCTVVQRKTAAKDGYDAIQIGYRPVRDKRLTKPQRGHLKRAGADGLSTLREVRFTAPGAEIPEVGTRITCEVFAAGDTVDIVGTTKGRGTTGVVKRHGFATLKESHGAHFFVRHAGSIGSRKPQHTLRGTRMAGRHGSSRVTVHNLEILRVDPERNLLYVKGAIPGAPRSLVEIRTARKAGPPTAR